MKNNIELVSLAEDILESAVGVLYEDTHYDEDGDEDEVVVEGIESRDGAEKIVEAGWIPNPAREIEWTDVQDLNPGSVLIATFPDKSTYTYVLVPEGGASVQGYGLMTPDVAADQLWSAKSISLVHEGAPLA